MLYALPLWQNTHNEVDWQFCPPLLLAVPASVLLRMCDKFEGSVGSFLGVTSSCEPTVNIVSTFLLEFFAHFQRNQLMFVKDEGNVSSTEG